jgi:hypothetical protein
MISEHHNYDNGYIGLVDLKLNGLPDKISVEGYELLLKSEHHISLICAKKIAPLIDANRAAEIEAEIVEFFKQYIQRTPLTEFSLTGLFRLVKRDERVTLVAMVNVPGVGELFNELAGKYGVELPLQPTHITLYTLQPETGIGILSPAELERDSHAVDVALKISAL